MRTTLHIMRILTSRGDNRVLWDPVAAEAGDREAKAAVREAERIFNQHRALGGTAIVFVPGRPATYVGAFDPLLDHILLLPPIIGG